MRQPQNYDNVKAAGDYIPVKLGGHYMAIKQVSETKSKTGMDMIVVFFDFAGNDSQPGKFSAEFEDDVRPDKKWPNQGTKYILIKDAKTGDTSRSFKTFCTCAEKSNPGFEVRWGDNWGQQFKGKKIGGVFGEELDFYNGNETTKRVLRFFTSWDKVADASIPNKSETRAHKEYKKTEDSMRNIESGDFMKIPDGLEEELPFV